ncbi:pyrroline-5-carboxylate reductase dimerization domain-containing protein (plasmid) [Rhodococcus qingshengii]
MRSAVGSEKMLEESDGNPSSLREAVTSPGGTTASAIREWENRGVHTAVRAIETAHDRAAELGKQHNN